MPRVYHRHAFGLFGLLGVLATSLGLMGCPGSLDSSLLNNGSGTGGTSGGTGTGGSASVNCTGTNDGATLITTNCAISGCHIPGGVQSEGLDLTIDATIGSRLVGVLSPGASGSVCGGWPTPYLTPGAIPTPTGLLIDKIKGPPPCGDQMPWPGPPEATALTATQLSCVEAWAEGLITAAQ